MMQQRQQQQQQMLAQQGMHGNMPGANGIPMAQQMQMNQMNAQQFAQMRNQMNAGAMRQAVPAHLQQAHLAQQGQHPGVQNAQHAAVSCHYDHLMWEIQAS